ncbi:hypothetical protein SNE40_012067 [Patella caerulea]|uniref:Polyamine-modulated factor 1 n=1 Tax=Patella caerulea TaxID=87958 RepID=A0AAN8PQ57_PATCE
MESDGRRMQLLRHSMQKTIDKFASVAKFKVFAQNLKPIYKKDPDGFRHMHTQMISQFSQHLSEELECMYKEERLPELLKQLDTLSKNSDKSVGNVWRPCGEAEVDIQAHLLPIKIKQRDELREMLKTLESQNRLLQGALKSKQMKIMETSDKIEEYHDKWKQISDCFASEKMVELDKFNEHQLHT